MSEIEIKRSKEYMTISDRADGITMRAFEHQRNMEQIFTFREANRLMKSPHEIKPTTAEGKPLTRNDYMTIARGNIETRHRQRLDRISSVKLAMQEKLIQRRLEHAKANRRTNQATAQHVKENATTQRTPKESNWFQRVFNKNPPDRALPDKQIRHKRVTVEYTLGGKTKRETKTERTTSYFKGGMTSKAKQKFEGIHKETTSINGQISRKEKILTVERNYTIGGTQERDVHRSIERRFQKQVEPSKSLSVSKNPKASKSFNRVRSR